MNRLAPGIFRQLVSLKLLIVLILIFRLVAEIRIIGVSLDIENYCTIRASPACQRRCLRFLSALQLKIKGRDCGTINGHGESSSIRALMKDAREVLVR